MLHVFTVLSLLLPFSSWQPRVPTKSQTYFQLPNLGLPPQAQQNEPSECRGSQFGCCYDNMASALGPLGEGCVGQPSYSEWMSLLVLPGG